MLETFPFLIGGSLALSDNKMSMGTKKLVESQAEYIERFRQKKNDRQRQWNDTESKEEDKIIDPGLQLGKNPRMAISVTHMGVLNTSVTTLEKKTSLEGDKTRHCSIEEKTDYGFFFFAKLPTELRLIIWKFALPGARFIDFLPPQEDLNFGEPWNARVPWVVPALFWVCHETKELVEELYTPINTKPGSPRIWCDLSNDIFCFHHWWKPAIYTRKRNRFPLGSLLRRVHESGASIRRVMLPMRLTRTVDSGIQDAEMEDLHDKEIFLGLIPTNFLTHRINRRIATFENISEVHLNDERYPNTQKLFAKKELESPDWKRPSLKFVRVIMDLGDKNAKDWGDWNECPCHGNNLTCMTLNRSQLIRDAYMDIDT
ncbi:hypothetical protein HYFRA_00003477 [Hymenoscyphus fraxineus]|uniref:2EXR domain-containing protein n=1 Tax=Hymenoscyphus fraxineus TaxID=746836 RepID=A0A9N9PT97_9HELO|nr:hypothetical protein HYFRA_00003477 [Hymenoscyphus fraxineus]